MNSFWPFLSDCAFGVARVQAHRLFDLAHLFGKRSTFVLDIVMANKVVDPSDNLV